MCGITKPSSGQSYYSNLTWKMQVMQMFQNKMEQISRYNFLIVFVAARSGKPQFIFLKSIHWVLFYTNLKKPPPPPHPSKINTTVIFFTQPLICQNFWNNQRDFETIVRIKSLEFKILSNYGLLDIIKLIKYPIEWTMGWPFSA